MATKTSNANKLYATLDAVPSSTAREDTYSRFAADIVDMLSRQGVPAMTLFNADGHALVFCAAGVPGEKKHAAAAFAPWTKGGPVILRLDVGFISRMKRQSDHALHNWAKDAREYLEAMHIACPKFDKDLLLSIDDLPSDIRDGLDTPPVYTYLLDFISPECCRPANPDLAKAIAAKIL